jgi:hypothetical protein
MLRTPFFLACLFVAGCSSSEDPQPAAVVDTGIESSSSSNNGSGPPSCEWARFTCVPEDQCEEPGPAEPYCEGGLFCCNKVRSDVGGDALGDGARDSAGDADASDASDAADAG